jgi:hypothetical protein
VPVDFNDLFQQYISFMQRLAEQQAYALKWVVGVVEVFWARTQCVEHAHSDTSFLSSEWSRVVTSRDRFFSRAECSKISIKYQHSFGEISVVDTSQDEVRSR